MDPDKIIKKLASLKMAVVVIISIGTLIAWGTIVEAIYNDARAAQELVYHSWFSYTIFAFFALNLTAVIVNRYPWKRHHIGFISAHIGILILLLGSLLTRYYGVDGSMMIDIGGSNNRVMLNETFLYVHAGLPNGRFTTIQQGEVNFLRNPPFEKKPYVVPLPSGDLQLVDFYPYAAVDAKIVASPDNSNPAAVRFQISNDRFAQTEWVLGQKGRPSEYTMGPARVILTSGEFSYAGGNVLVMKPVDDKTIAYEVYSDREKKKIRSGKAKAGAQVELGWMNLQLKILAYHQHAEQQVGFVQKDRASEKTISAVKVRFNGREQWIGLNNPVRLFGDNEVYVVNYGNRELPLDFKIQLKDFQIGRYQGTKRAATYSSRVFIPQLGEERTISMNEPLDFRGYTFYQASFKEDPGTGQPAASVLSVNFDPGRWVKYAGCLLIVFGAIHLFYRRWKKARPANA